MNASLHGVTAVGVSFFIAACAQQPRLLQMNPGPSKSEPTLAEASRTLPVTLNDACPITGDAVDPKYTVSYQGRKIAFCCENCFREFRESDEAGKAAIAAKLNR